MDCKGCKNENSTDIHVHLAFCNYCKRSKGTQEEKDMHDDKYEKVFTNADHIRAMSDEELAEWLAGIDHYWNDGECIVRFGDTHIEDSKYSILDWLQSENDF